MGRVFLCILTVNLFLLSCTKNSEVTIEKLTIVYSGNIGGQKNPCGCEPPLGGFARRSTVINSIRKAYENVLVLDSGALLYSNNFLVPPYDYIFRLNAPILTRVVDQIGIDAVNMSSFDLSNSADSLLAIDSATSLPWIASNLTWRNSGELVFKPDMIVSRGSIKIGIFGIMADNFMGSPLYNEDSPLKVLDYIETADKEVSKLKHESDIIIALAYVSDNDAYKLAESVSGIDILILSHNGYHDASSDHNAFAPLKKNKTLIVRCPDGGRVIGCLELKIAGNSTDFREVLEGDTPSGSSPKETVKQRNRKSTYRNYFYDLGPEIISDKDIQDQIDAIEPLLKAYRDSLGIS